MKVIDLLNKIANGEEAPKKVKYNDVIFKKEDGDLLNDIYCSLFEHRGNECEKLLPMLNDEVEIIEEEKKIPEKLNIEDDGNAITLFGEKENEWTILDNVDVSICNKINEIIDYLKSKGDE